MKVLSTILLVCLVFSAQGFKNHFLKQQPFVRSEHLVKTMNHLYDTAGVAGAMQPCNAVGFLQCVQNNLDPSYNEYLAEQVLSLVEQLQQLQQQHQENPEQLQQVVIQQLTKLTQDPKTGNFWICSFGSLSPSSPACQTQSAFFRKSTINLQFPFAHKLTTKKLHNVHQKRMFEAINKLHDFVQHKDEEYSDYEDYDESDDEGADWTQQRGEIKCYIISLLNAIQALDQSDDLSLVKQFIHLSKIKDQAESDLEDPQAKARLILSLICDQNTGVFWKSLLSGVVQCQGQANVDFSQIPCSQQ